MENDSNKEEEKFGLNQYAQFGTFTFVFLGIALAEYIYDHVKKTESKSAEA